jgi:hypothetical protein
VAGTRLHWVALAFAIAALLSAWNPLAAPFGLVVGLSAALVALRAGARGARRPAWVPAFALALLAAVGSAFVLAHSAGIGRSSAPGAVVPTPAPSEVERELDTSAKRTAPSRARARSELDRVAPEGPAAAPRPRNR